MKYSCWCLTAIGMLVWLSGNVAHAQNTFGVINPPGTGQHVCSNDATRTCVSDAGCASPGTCTISAMTVPSSTPSAPNTVNILATTDRALTLLSANINFTDTTFVTPTNALCGMIKQTQVNPDALQKAGRTTVDPAQGGAVCGTCTAPLPPGTACTADSACQAATGACSSGTCTFPARSCTADSDCGGGSCVSGSCIFFAPRCTNCVGGTCTTGECGSSGTCNTSTSICNPQPPHCTLDADCSGTCNLTPKVQLSVFAASPSAILLCSNLPNSTLSAAIGTSDTSIPLVSASGFQSSGTVLIESELIAYTGISGSMLTGAVRGMNNTTAAAHAAGTAVTDQISCDSDADCPAGTTPCNAPIPAGSGNIAQWTFTVNSGVHGGVFGLAPAISEAEKGPVSVPIQSIFNGVLRVIPCVGDQDFSGSLSTGEASRCQASRRLGDVSQNPVADEDGNGQVSTGEASRCVQNRRLGTCNR